MSDLHGILNGNKNVESKNYETFQNTFGKWLEFSLMYDFLKTRKQYIYNKDIPHASCLCEICENVCLLAKGISKSLKNDGLPVNPHDIVEEYACDTSSRSCMFGECIVCSLHHDLYFNQNESGESDIDFEHEDEKNTVTYSKW